MKYQSVAQYLREYIVLHANEPLHPLPTEQDLQDRFGVSRQTVRKAISILKEEGLIKSRRGSGYYLAKAADSSSMQIAVITTFMDDYIFPAVLRDMENILSPNGYKLQVYSTLNRVSAEREILQQIKSHPVGGIIVEGSKTALPNPNTDLYQKLRDMGIPIVFFQGHYPDLSHIPAVTDNNFAGGYMLAKYLISKGHKSIGGVFKSDDIQGPERYGGMMNALRDAGLPVPDHAVCWYDSEQRARLIEDKDESLLIRFIKERLPASSAVICYNDEIAYHLIKDIQSMGKKVPKDFAVVSFDNSYYSRICPVPITSLGHKAGTMGTQAASKLLDLLRGKEARSSAIPWNLVIRASG